VKKGIPETCAALKKYAVPLVDAFYPLEDLMDSMIAPNDGNLYASIINRVYTSPKAFERTKEWKHFY